MTRGLDSSKDLRQREEVSTLSNFFVDHGMDISTPWLLSAGNSNIRLDAVLGGYVYIDGGEVSQLVNGVPDLGQGGYGSSLSSKSTWTNEPLAIRAIPKQSAPIVNFGRPWKSPSGTKSLFNGNL
ncbi:hypothetical protein B0O99DRAFT_591112 [Bisporella sp. PMI_857]|nr:hypothetical protein B0O99DRAFT_591112 [Bisporella sp. PMI_857]